MNKREKEIQVVSLMIDIYCKGHHKQKDICDKCNELKEYAIQRTMKCPFMETKTFCSNCKVHCYRGDKKDMIKKVMRYSGPRMLFYHPILAIKHVILSYKEKSSKK